jgi:hypothetical protein
MSTIYTERIQKLYVAYFGRPADYDGLHYWETVVASHNGSAAIFATISAEFAASAEYQATYAGQTPYQIVDSIYLNLLNRGADLVGRAYWGDKLVAGALTIDNVVEAIVNSALTGPNAADKAVLQAKIAAAVLFTQALDTPAEVQGYAGPDAAEHAHDWLHDVTAPVTQDQVNAAVEDVVAAGSTYTLTSREDVASAYNFVATPDYTPGLNDLVNTLQNIDVLTGLGSHAKLTAVLDNSNDNGNVVIAPTLVNIETIAVEFRDTYSYYYSGGISVLDLQDSDHVLKNINVTGVSTEGFLIENLHVEANKLSVSDTQAKPYMVFTYLNEELAGTNDTVTLKLTDVYADMLILGSNGGVGPYSGPSGGGQTEQIEHVVIESNGDPVIDLVNLLPDQLTLSGAGTGATYQDLAIVANNVLILGKDWNGNRNYLEHNNAFTTDTVESLNKITVTGSGNVTLASVGSAPGFELAAGAATGKIAVNISNAADDASAKFTTGTNDDTILVDDLNAEISSGSGSGSTSDITFAGTLHTGSGNDSVTAHDLAAGTLSSGYAGAKIYTESGNDTVTVETLLGLSGAPLIHDYAGAFVDLGDGNDTINADSLETEAQILAGSGNDVVNLTEKGVERSVYTVIAGDNSSLDADLNGAEVILGAGDDNLNILLTGTLLWSAGSGVELINGYVDGGSGADTLSITGNKKGYGNGFLEVVAGKSGHDNASGSGIDYEHAIVGIETLNLTSTTAYSNSDASAFTLGGSGVRTIIANDNNSYTADYAVNRAEFDNNDTVPGSLTINLIHQDGVIRNIISETLTWTGFAGDEAYDYLYNLAGTEAITISALETDLLDNGENNVDGTGTGNVSASDPLGTFCVHGSFDADLILDIAHDASTGDRIAEITLKDIATLNDIATLADPSDSPLDPGDVNYDVSINDVTGSGNVYTSLALTVNGDDNHGIDLNNDFATRLDVTGDGTGGGNLTITNVNAATIQTGGVDLLGGYKGNVDLDIESSVAHTVTTGLGNDIVRLDYSNAITNGFANIIKTGAGNDIVRLGDEAAISLGNDSVDAGSGDDIVFFNGLATGWTVRDDSGSGLVVSGANSAGLENGDTVAGGAGTGDILAFGGETSHLIADGGEGDNAVGVSIRASEWEHVSGFETIRLSVGQGEPVSYYLEITNQLIDDNGGTTGNVLNIINNNAGTCSSGIDESNTTLDLRGDDSLNLYNEITYVGAAGTQGSGSGGSDDRFIFNNVNLDGGDTINGGYVAGGNNDVLEIRNTAQVTSAVDLANISNVGNISFNNDQGGAQTLTLDLTDAIVSQLVDATAGVDTLYITANDHSFVSTAAAVLSITASSLTSNSNLFIVGDDTFAGDDYILTGDGADTIYGYGGNDTINAGGGNDSIYGGTQADTIYGGAGNDYVEGDGNADIIFGDAGEDTIYGGAGDDTIYGGAGNDNITLDAGNNVLMFNSLTGADTITDYSVADDSISLSQATFTALTVGVLAGGEFVANATGTAVDGNDYIVYNIITGALSYDADGDGVGGAVLIGTFTNVPGLVAGEFTVVA